MFHVLDYLERIKIHLQIGLEIPLFTWSVLSLK